MLKVPLLDQFNYCGNIVLLDPSKSTDHVKLFAFRLERCLGRKIRQYFRYRQFNLTTFTRFVCAKIRIWVLGAIYFRAYTTYSTLDWTYSYIVEGSDSVRSYFRHVSAHTDIKCSNTHQGQRTWSIFPQ